MTQTNSNQSVIEHAWENRDALDVSCDLLRAIQATFESLGQGRLRVAEKINNEWYTHQWIKKAILLSFRTQQNAIIGEQSTITTWYDKVPLKCAQWKVDDFQNAQFRSVPGAIVRESAYIAPGVVLMPSFVNMGAYVGQNTMVDTWSTIGSCAQIGRNCHISGGVGIGGVLEPIQANPVIIEDDCFIGARSEIAEGVIVEQGAVISMGVFIGASTKIIDRQTGESYRGRVPAYSVVVPGSLPSSDGKGPSLACAVIVKRVDAQTRSKTSINDLLRD
ncbi:MAG: 2,3,4,5-tetrahydropyridine-2,6-dicarboxylate N-succinyltransferase [Alphaproteobacteria bacterium]|nr:2,3,4,5-tetrahydropyridine-2,6-dicarboxylate N-succinyltransferase [Alphaproteobacteria bacterium]